MGILREGALTVFIFQKAGYRGNEEVVRAVIGNNDKREGTMCLFKSIGNHGFLRPCQVHGGACHGWEVTSSLRKSAFCQNVED